MRRFLLPLVLASALSAATLDAEYSLSYSIFPAIGTTTLHFESGRGRYRIVAEAKLRGLAAVLAHHHTERHTSIGALDGQGRLIPERYETLRTMDDFRRERRYLFDRTHHDILFEERTERRIKTKRFDPIKMRYIPTEQNTTARSRRIEPYDAENDLLSLYFNARPLLATLPPNTSVDLPAAGTIHGSVTIERDMTPLHYTLFLDQDIFRSSKGEMAIETDETFFIRKAVLKDVFLFGDLSVEREWLRQSP